MSAAVLCQVQTTCIITRIPINTARLVPNQNKPDQSWLLYVGVSDCVLLWSKQHKSALVIRIVSVKSEWKWVFTDLWPISAQKCSIQRWITDHFVHKWRALTAFGVVMLPVWEFGRALPPSWSKASLVCGYWMTHNDTVYVEGNVRWRFDLGVPYISVHASNSRLIWHQRWCSCNRAG